jgi:hypothetical protein
MENDLTKSQELKSLFFANENNFFSKFEKKQDFHVKSTTEILSNLTTHGSFNKVKETYRLNMILSKILLKSHMNWIAYSYYKDKKLILGAYGHIGQSELNMQKYVLLENLRKINRYSDIVSVNILREEIVKDQNISHIKSTIMTEKSYGIFDNNITNKMQFDIVERIKKNIRK